jgi:oligosaccharide repeat unit polymerase
LLASRVDRRLGTRLGVKIAVALMVAIPLISAFGLDFERAISVIRRARAGAIEDMFPGLAVNFYWIGLFGSTLLLVDGLVFSRGLGRWKALLGLLFSAPLWMTGARHLAMYLILPLLLAWVLTRPARGGLRRTLILAVALAVLVVSLQLVLAVRSRGWDHVREIEATELLHMKPTLQFSSLLFAVYLVPEHHEHFREPMTPYFLYHWIPRRYWPEKPVSRSWTFYNDTWVENRKTNVTPSVAGQYYINWSWPGVVFIGVWLGWLTANCDRISLQLHPSSQKLALVSVGLFYAFIFCSFRYYSPYYLQYWIFGSIAMLLLTRRASRRELETAA